MKYKNLQLTKEEANELFYGLPFKGFDNYSFYNFKTCLMANGFMGKTDMQKAEENYEKSFIEDVSLGRMVRRENADNYINELKKEIKRLEP